MKNTIILGLISATLLVSCAHTPTQGDKMLAVSNHAKDLSDKWGEGNKLSLSGEATQKKGQSLTRDGVKMVDEGQTMISKGNSMVSEGREQSIRGLQLKQQTENSFSEQYTERSAS